VLDDGSIDIKVTESEDFAQSCTCVPDPPVREPQGLLDAELQFEALSKDILGRAVVEQAIDRVHGPGKDVRVRLRGLNGEAGAECLPGMVLLL
jgi:hypothetical protein